MTLEEAIKHCLEVAEKQEKLAENNMNIQIEKYKVYDADEYIKYKECAEEHRQLAEWLRELKERREQHEVIRCKDCKYYYNTNPKNIPTANIICFQMHEDDYCSYAERRTDE